MLETSPEFAMPPSSPASPPDQPDADAPRPEKVLTPAAQRALAEAAERRRLAEPARPAAPREINGREGPDPVRYGDWEVKGLASDF